MRGPRPERGPLLVPAEVLVERGVWFTEWGSMSLPASLMTKWGVAVAAGWQAQVIYVRAAELDAAGAPKVVQRKEPLFDEGGNRMLTARGAPRNRMVDTDALAVVDTFNLIAQTRYEGAAREVTALWTTGKFAGALMRQPLMRLSATEVTEVLRRHGVPPHRQAGVPLSLAAELAAKAAAKEESSDDER